MSKSKCCQFCKTDPGLCRNVDCQCHPQPKPTDKGLEKFLKELNRVVSGKTEFIESLITQAYNTAKAEGYEQGKLEIEDKAYRTGKRDGFTERVKQHNESFESGERAERARIIKIVSDRLCQLANCIDPYKAVKSLNHEIYKHNPPHDGRIELQALAQAHALSDILKHLNK